MAAHEHFVNFSEFGVRRPLDERRTEVGYLGRLSPEKGIENFLSAAAIILEHRRDIRFSVAGGGPLYSPLRAFIQSRRLGDNVRLLGFVPHEEICDYLNQIRLLVLPSYTEGLPSTIVEAFATGTPVLATAVGALPDFVRDGETGFVLKDNSPDTIAKQVVETLNRPDLVKVAKTARQLAEREFSYTSAAERFREILSAKEPAGAR